MIIQRTGRLITKQQLRLFGDGSGNGNPLLFSPRKLPREITASMGQSDELQNFTCIHAVLLHLICQLDILKGGQIWYQIIKLKYKPDIIAPVFHQLSAIAGGDISAIHKQLSAGGGIHTAQNIQCRRLAGT